jgi:CRISPR-associated protein Csm3
LENNAQTDQPYTETKWEAVIDRVTSAAVPRQMERVPAGTLFNDARLVYSVYGTPGHHSGFEDVAWFFDVLQMLLMVEDDYLGSSGSRGSGRIQFENLRLSVRRTPDYTHRPDPLSYASIEDLLSSQENLKTDLLSFFQGN